LAGAAKEGISKQKVSTYDMEQSGTLLSIGDSPLPIGVTLKVSIDPTAKKDWKFSPENYQPPREPMEAAGQGRNIASAQLKKGRSGIEECQLSGATLYYVGASGPDPCRNELQLEGVIAKRKSSLEPGTRSGAWLKYKLNQSQDRLYRLIVSPVRGFGG
jgi:hypothetical protein